MDITIIGTGYVGLVTGTCLAEFGHQVTCVDKVAEKIDKLQNGEIPIYEPGLEALVIKNVNEGRLSFTTSLSESIPQAKAVFIAVGTPTSKRGDGYADLSYIFEASRDIAPYLNGYTVIVDKSTVPVGTAAQVERIIFQGNPQADFDVASNPEFLREGAAISDFMHPDRVVIGVKTERAEKVLREIYKPLYLQETPIVCTTVETAELIKYAANAFLAVKISFINEMANVCEAVGADISALAKAIGMDGRIGGKFLHPGPGYGGSCFPKDTVALLRIVQELGAYLGIVNAAVEANYAQKARMIKKIREAMGNDMVGAISVLGLTFKPETDDMREAPSLSIIPALAEKGALVKVFDPQGMKEAKKLLPEGIYYSRNAYDACEGTEAVVLLTAWNQFRALDWEEIRESMVGDNPAIIDLQNIYFSQRSELRKMGFRYTCVGEKLF